MNAGSPEHARPQAVAIAEGWRPGAIGRVVELLATYHARHWGLGAYFEAKVAHELAEFIARYDRDHDRLFLALDGERVIGAIAIDGSDATAASEGVRVRWFILDEAWHGRGIGKRLLAAAMAFLAERRCARCYLTTFAGLDAARALYERAGFRLVGETAAASWGPRLTEQRFEWQRAR